MAGFQTTHFRYGGFALLLIQILILIFAKAFKDYAHLSDIAIEDDGDR